MLKPIRRLKRALMSKLIESGAPSGGTENPSLAAQLDGHLTFCAIASALKDGRPFLAGRLGWFETYALGHWDRLGSLTESLKNKMWNTPGIFPATTAEFERFRESYLLGMAKADLLGLMHCPFEKELITAQASQAMLCELSDLEPYFQQQPWSRLLAGKRVLVIHPFADSIHRQYHSLREKLFFDEHVLPEFDLQVLLPPQTMCGNTGGYASWSEALERLREKIAERMFDAAIVGCGAYGLPVGAFVKSLGKPCIHLGGATQILFGLRGGRWDANPRFRPLINSFWGRPSEEERPPNWESAEKGCYW